MFYKIKLNISAEVIGKPTFQIDRFESDLPYETWKDRDPQFMRDLNKYDFHLENFIVAKGSKLTDLIGYKMGGCQMISKDLYSVILQYGLVQHDFFPVVLKHEDSGEFNYNYGIFRSRLIGAERFADYSKSLFALNYQGDKPLEPIEISSFEELLEEFEIWRGGVFRQATKLALNKEFKLDLFTLRTNTDFYVSDRLKMRLEYEGFSEILFEHDPSIVIVE